MPRDEFSPKVKREVAHRAGNLCSFCAAPTSGPHSDPSKAQNVGVAAHITAAAPGGPRYDPTLTPQERAGINNAIWMCETHGKLVDNDDTRFTVSELHKLKNDAEQKALAAIGKPQETSPTESERSYQRMVEMEISKACHIVKTNYVFFLNPSLPEGPYKDIWDQMLDSCNMDYTPSLWLHYQPLFEQAVPKVIEQIEKISALHNTAISANIKALLLKTCSIMERERKVYALVPGMVDRGAEKNPMFQWRFKSVFEALASLDREVGREKEGESRP